MGIGLYYGGIYFFGGDGGSLPVDASVVSTVGPRRKTPGFEGEGLVGFGGDLGEGSASVFQTTTKDVPGKPGYIGLQKGFLLSKKERLGMHLD